MAQGSLLLIVFLGFNSFAQEEGLKFRFGVSGGIATYSFENLEDVNKGVIERMPFDVAVVDNFLSHFILEGLR